MNKFMEVALEEAYKAFEVDEIPIGCVIVLDGEIIAKAHNTREKNNDISCHAEINALRIASQKLGTWKLDNCEMYVTVEPCIMCYGAILQSRIKKVYIGSVQDSIKQHSYKKFVTNDTIIEELLNNESKEIMQIFFQKRR